MSLRVVGGGTLSQELKSLEWTSNSSLGSAAGRRELRQQQLIISSSSSSFPLLSLISCPQAACENYDCGTTDQKAAVMLGPLRKDTVPLSTDRRRL